MKKILLTTTALHQPWNEGDWDMTDGNTYEISKHLDEREDWDALQEVTAELDQAEARIAELEAKLAKAVESFRVIEDASRLYASDRESDIENVRYAHECTRRLCVATIAELSSPVKGETE